MQLSFSRTSDSNNKRCVRLERVLVPLLEAGGQVHFLNGDKDTEGAERKLEGGHYLLSTAGSDKGRVVL
jgi:hypothetical protein